MLLILLMAKNLFKGLFTAYRKMNSQFFKNTLTKIWRTDLSGHQNRQLMPLFSLCLSISLTEAFSYMFTSEVSVI